MQAMVSLYLFTILVVSTLATEPIRFDNYKVYRLTPTNKKQVQLLKDLESFGGYTYWNEVERVNKPVDIMVPPHLNPDFKDSIDKNGITNEILIDDVQKYVEATIPKSRASVKELGWTQYSNLEDIYSWLNEISADYPDQVQVLSIGQSYEGREVKGVRVSFSQANANRTVFIEGGIHAREWISPATVTYILNEFLTNSNASIQNIARSFDWFFFPVANPDGYDYTFTTNRLWRKTRTRYSSFCYGADPNRNWDVHWLEGGASNVPCSETYAGAYPFSENSTKVLSQFLNSIGDSLVGYISFHSYSQLLLTPYGHTEEHLDNYDELKRIGDKAAASLAVRYGTQYTVGNVAETIYVATGSSMDWVKSTFGTRITYTYELRDTGRYGFLLPPEQIIPTGQETLDSLITIFEEALATEN